MSLDFNAPHQKGHSFAGQTFVRELQQTILHTKKFPRKAMELVPKSVLPHGWLIPQLLQLDLYTWQRWAYWIACMERGELIEAPVPQIPWLTGHDQCHSTPAMKMLQRCLDSIPRSGGWQTWSGWTYFNYFMDWLLYAFGYAGQREPPPEPMGCDGASSRLYQTFCLESMLAWPYDYWGDLLAENKHGQAVGFYPTPLDVALLMVKFLFPPGGDYRTQTLCDPCVGTGRFALVASNYVLRIYACDIDLTVIKATLVNGYCYAPWLVKPFPFLDADLVNPAYSAEMSEAMIKAGSGKPGVARYYANTEHDSENQWRVEPIKKRRYVSGESPPVTFEEVFRIPQVPSVLPAISDEIAVETP